MMTREEAIDILENEKMCVNNETCQREECATCSLVMDKDKILTALDMAISALRPVSREQVEKVWRGKWLNFYNDFSTAECSRCGEICEVSPGETPQENYFNAFKEFYHFCPNCGASMTDEAVQMVMERMEEMKNG